MDETGLSPNLKQGYVLTKRGSKTPSYITAFLFIFSIPKVKIFGIYESKDPIMGSESQE